MYYHSNVKLNTNKGKKIINKLFFLINKEKSKKIHKC